MRTRCVWPALSPPPLLCIRPAAAAAGMSAAIEARLESDVNWAGDWFVDGECLKMEDGVGAGEKTGGQTNKEREGQIKQPSDGITVLRRGRRKRTICSEICMENHVYMSCNFR